MNLHYAHQTKPQFFNLGLIRVHGSLPAEACVAKVNMKLDEFGLSLEKDISCIKTDGANVMKKVGRLVPSEHLLCVLHGLQLAVVDVMYVPRTIVAETSDNDDESSDDDECDDGVMAYF